MDMACANSSPGSRTALASVSGLVSPLQTLQTSTRSNLKRFIPESPRFLVAKGYEGKASKILAKYHANAGDEHDPLVVFELAQIRHAIRMEEEATRITSWLTLFSTPGNRKRMRLIVAIAIFSQWR